MMKTKIMHSTVQINKVKNSRLFTNAILVYYYDEIHVYKFIKSSLLIRYFTFRCNSSMLINNNGHVLVASLIKQNVIGIITSLNLITVHLKQFWYSTLLYLVPINTMSSNTKLLIKNSNFQNNYALNLIKSRSAVKILLQLSHFRVVMQFSSNFH